MTESFEFWRIIRSFDVQKRSIKNVCDTLGDTSMPLLGSVLVHPGLSKTHWATRRRQPSLLTASCWATSQVTLMLFKFCSKVSFQFFCGLPGFLLVPLISQCTACLGSLLSSIRRTCPRHLGLLSFMMRSTSPVVSAPWPSCYWLYLSMRNKIICLWNLWCAASSFLFCATVSGHNSAPYNIVDITNDSYNLTLSVVLICLFFHTDFNLPNTLLALPILVWQSLS